MSKNWVVKDCNGNYVTTNRCFVLTDEGWLYCTYTGKATGFSFYSNKLTAKKELENLKKLNNKYDFKKKFDLEYEDINNIPNGERMVLEIKN